MTAKRMTSAFAAVLSLVAVLGGQTPAPAPPRAIERPGGAILLTEQEYEALPLADVPATGTLPERHDLSASFPPVGDQGQQGSCVGWAVAYAVKSYHERAEIAWPFAPNSLFSPAYIYNQAKVNTCMGGAYYPTALNLLVNRGAASLADFKYDPSDCDRAISATVHKAAGAFKARSWSRVDTRDLAELKSHLVAGDPVLITLKFDRAFQALQKDSVYQGVTGDSLGFHAVVVVGYDNDKGAFRIINSWGTGWADAGYGWISYTAFTGASRSVREGYIVIDETTPRPAPGEEDAPAAAALPAEMVTFATTFRAMQPYGNRTVTRGTGNHHCSSNCEGEPTRTNYQLSLSALQGRVLTNPRLTCIGGSCPWSSVLFVRLEDEGRKAIASWDVWSKPTTWVLEADEFAIRDVGTKVERVARGELLELTVGGGQPAPRVEAKLPDSAEVTFVAGENPPTPAITFVGRRETNGIPTFVYRVAQ